MDFVDAIILGIIEGITEFLPISSTGHLIMAGRVLGLEQTEFLKTFEIAIQLGAILAVLFLYGRTLLLNQKILRRVAAAFIPTAVVGLVLYKLIKHVLMENISIILWALCLGGICLIAFEIIFKEKESSTKQLDAISYPQAIAIGLFQSLAVIPGVSRAAATIIGGLLQGISRKTIVEFSFLLAIPTMLAATGLDLYKNAGAFSTDQFLFLATGFIVSFFVAVAAIKFLIRYVQKHTFVIFGVYRIAIALVFWLSVK